MSCAVTYTAHDKTLSKEFASEAEAHAWAAAIQDPDHPQNPWGSRATNVSVEAPVLADDALLLLALILRGKSTHLYLNAIKKGTNPAPVLVDVRRDDFVERIAAFTARHAHSNVYFGVASRDGGGQSGEHLEQLSALFADVDFKQTPQGEARHRIRLLEQANAGPSLIIETGGGYHLYWALRKPVSVATAEQREAAKILLRDLAKAVGGDLSAAEPARILRLPGTLNHKYDPPRPVQLVGGIDPRFDPWPVPDAEAFDRLCHDLRDIVKALDAAEIHLRRLGKWEDEPAAGPFQVPDQVKTSARHETLFKLTRSLKLKRVPKDAAIEAAVATNRRFSPPLEEAEVRSYVPRVYDQPDREGLLPKPDRTLKVTPASEITPRRVRWAWQDRVPLGGLSLIAGRESGGKSSVAYERAARITRGQLVGDLHGQSRGVIVVATEDSWEYTIVPRLKAAGADLSKVYRVTAQSQDFGAFEISLPDDIPELETIIRERNVALIILDPIISRLGSLDTHKDAEVRTALEPIVGLADRTGATVLGVIHLNKTATTDPLTALMGSRAFAAVARAVMFVAREADNRILCFPKSNLGPEAKSQTFRIDSTVVGEDPDDRQPIKTGVVVWGAEINKTAREVLEDQSRANTAGPRKEAKAWLSARLEGGPVDSSVLKDEAEDAGIAPATLERAMRALRCVVRSGGFPRKTSWALPHPLLSVCEATEGTDATDATEASAVVSVASRPGTMPL